MRFNAHVTLLLLLLSLMACGFHLRGQNNMAETYRHLTVEWSGDRDFDAELKTALKESAIIIGKSPIILTISLTIRPEHVLAQSASGLKVELLSLELNYSLYNQNSNKSIATKVIVQKQEFESDSNVLASNSEKAKAYKHLKSNAIRVLLYQLQRLS